MSQTLIESRNPAKPQLAVLSGGGVPAGIEAIGSFVTPEALAAILTQPTSQLIAAAVGGRLGEPMTSEATASFGIELSAQAQRNIALFRIEQPKAVLAFFSEQSQTDAFISNALGAIERTSTRQGYRLRRISTAQSDVRTLIAMNDQAAGYVPPANLLAASPLQRTFLQIIDKAVKERATDIHLHLVDGFGRLSFRKNREREFKDEIDGADAAALKQLAMQFCTNIGNNQDEQIGRTASFDNNSSEMRRLGARLPKEIEAIRLAVGPTAYGGRSDGFLLALRLAYKQSGNEPTRVEEMGYLPRHLQAFDRIVHAPSGGMFISGPMGSAKTTLLAALTGNLIREARERILVVSAEDPVERRIHGAAQWQIYQGKTDEERRINWANAFKTILRLDANAMVLGEIRDSAAADQVFEMIMTGLRVFTSVHSNNAVGVLRRLDLLGIQPGVYLDPEVISGLVSQRLTPRLCPVCAMNYDKAKPALRNECVEMIDHFKLARILPDLGALRFRNWDGCTNPGCDRGATGLTVIAEVLEPDHEFMNLYGLNPRDPRHAIAYAQQNRFLNLEQHILIKAGMGQIDLAHAHENARRLPRQFSEAAIAGITDELAACLAARKASGHD